MLVTHKSYVKQKRTAMKKLNLLALLSVMFMTVGLLSSCQKEDPNKSEDLNAVQKNAVVYDCHECVETWMDTRVTFDATHFIPQSSLGHMPENLYLDVYNDATTVYFRLYRLDDATIGYLQIGNQTAMNFDPPVTEYMWSQPLPMGWEACGKIEIKLIVGGVGQYVGHANFCEFYYFREVCEDNYECDGPSETAWAEGPRYTEKGNWAMYTEYRANTSVKIWAGQHNLAGTVHFSEVVDGQVTLHFELVDGWMFKNVQESLKIMTYTGIPPAKNPAPGQFSYKYDATGNTFSVTLPAAEYYGIHLDLMHCEY